jgi:hypothetical protein
VFTFTRSSCLQLPYSSVFLTPFRLLLERLLPTKTKNKGDCLPMLIVSLSIIFPVYLHSIIDQCIPAVLFVALVLICCLITFMDTDCLSFRSPQLSIPHHRQHINQPMTRSKSESKVWLCTDTTPTCSSLASLIL